MHFKDVTHCLLQDIAFSHKNISDYSYLFLFYIMCFDSLEAFTFFCIAAFCLVDCNDFLVVYHAWVLLNFLDVSVYSCYYIWKNCSH